MKYPIDEEKKADIAKDFLERYEHQEGVIAWQKQRLDDIIEMAIEGSPAPQDVRVQSSKLSDPTADAAIRIADTTDKVEAKLKEERAVLIEIYEDITAALGLLDDHEERSLLYDIYIKHTDISCSQLAWDIHPRTAARRHRKALIDLFDVVAASVKNTA